MINSVRHENLVVVADVGEIVYRIPVGVAGPQFGPRAMSALHGVREERVYVAETNRAEIRASWGYADISPSHDPRKFM